MSLLSERPDISFNRPTKKLDRYSKIQEGYQTEVPAEYPKRYAPSASAKFSNIPNYGQYILDKEHKDGIVQSVRKYNRFEKNQLMGGLSSDFFQIDHSIPIWAGGSDNIANKIRLSTGDHDKKTKVGAVARTLYYSGKLNLSGARSLAMNWKNKDVSDINLEEDGKLAKDNAEAVSKAMFFKAQFDKPIEVKVGWRDVWNEMKLNPITRATQSAISGLTGGWVEPEQAPIEKGRETEAKVANAVGSLGGTILSFAIGAKLLTGTLSLLKLGNIAKGASAYKSANAIIKADKIAVKMPRGMNALKSAGFFAGYGQLTRDAYEGDRVEKFLSDAAFGAITGYAGNSMKSYSGLAAGVYTLGILEGATPKESLMNSAIMVGFHGIGHKARKIQVQDVAEIEAIKYLTNDRKLKVLPEGMSVENYKPGSIKFTEEKANKILNESIKRLNKDISYDVKIDSGVYTPELIREIKSKLVTSSHQLWKNSLGEEERLMADVRDIRSMIKRERVNPETNYSMPEPQYELLLKNLNKLKTFEKGNISTGEKTFLKNNKGKLPVGDIPATGTKIGANGRNIINLVESGELKPGTKLFLKMRGDAKELNMAKNKDMYHWTDAAGNPKYMQELYYAGEDGLIRVGVIPSKNRMHERTKSLVPSSYDVKKISPELNKDVIGKTADKLGIDYMVVETKHVGVSEVSGQPSLSIKIIPESYSVSMGNPANKRLPVLTKIGKEIHTTLFGKDTLFNNLSSKDKKILKNMPLKGKITASNEIIAKNLSDKYSILLDSVIKPIENALKTGNIELLEKTLKDSLGLKVPRETVAKLLLKKDIKVGDILKMVDNAEKRVKSVEAVKKANKIYKKSKEEIEKPKKSIADKVKGLLTKKEEKAEKVKFEKAKKALNKEQLETAKAVSKSDKVSDSTADIEVKTSKNKETKIIDNRPEKLQQETHTNRNEMIEDDTAILANKVASEEKPVELKDATKSIGKDADVYDEMYGSRVLKLFADPLKKLINKARVAGDDKTVNRIIKDKEIFNRDNIISLAKKTYKDSGDKLYTSFELFKKALKKEYAKVGDKYPFKGAHENSLFKKYSQSIDAKPRRELVWKNGKVDAITEKPPEPGSFFGAIMDDFINVNAKEVKIFKDLNKGAKVPKDSEIISLDTEFSTFSKKVIKKKNGTEVKVNKTNEDKIVELEEAFLRKDSDFIPLGLADKKLSNFTVMRKNDFMVNKFNTARDKTKYLMKGENAAHLSNAEKQIKVLAVDVFGFSPNITSTKFMKRLKLLTARDPQVKIDANVRHIVLESPTVQEIRELSDKEMYAEIKNNFFKRLKNKNQSYEEWSKTKSGKSLIKGAVDGYQKAMFDGKSYMDKDMLNAFTKSVGMEGSRVRMKPIVAHKVDGKYLMLMKTDTSVYDKTSKEFFEKMIGRRIEKNEVVTFTDNVKVGNLKNEEGLNYSIVDLPANSYRIKYGGKHVDGKGSQSNYLYSNLKYNKRLELPVKKYFNKDFEKIKDIVKMLDNNIPIKTIADKHKIDISGMEPRELLKVMHGADILSGNKQVQDMVKNIILKKIVGGVTQNGRHLSFTPDYKNIIPRNHVGIDSKVFESMGKPEYVLTIRHPSKHTASMGVDKVIVLGKGSKNNKDMTHLGDEQVMFNNEDAVFHKNADWDGDTAHIFAIGKKEGNVPIELAKAIQSESELSGTLFPPEPIKIKSSTPDYLNMENLKASTRNTLLAGEGVSSTSSQARTLYTLESAGTRIETVVKDGQEKSFLSIGHGKDRRPLLDSGKSIKSNLKDGTYKKDFKYTDKEIQETITMVQRTVDAQTDSTLRELMGGRFNKNILIEALLGKNTGKSQIKVLNEMIDKIQDPHKLKSAKSYSDLKDIVKDGNSMIKTIESSGGNVGLVYKINQWLGELPDMIKTTGSGVKERRLQFEMKDASIRNIEHEFKDRFDSVGREFKGNMNFVKDVPANKDIDMSKVSVFINKVRDVNRSYENISLGRYLDPKTKKYKKIDINKEDIPYLKKISRKKFIKYWDENNYKLNQEEKDAFAFYIATAEDAFLGSTENTFLARRKSRSQYFSIFEGIVNEASESIAKSMYKGINSISKETRDLIMKDKNLETDIGSEKMSNILNSLQ